MFESWIAWLIGGAAIVALSWFHAVRARRNRVRLEAALELAKYREDERDQAQAELTKKLIEERDVGREKAQLQAQLAEYEKYAALAQLALGAAHEISNPLLGIMSHFELEMKKAATEEEKIEIEQCIDGAKRISATLKSLVDYARPAPPRLGRINLQLLVGDTLQFLRHQPMFHGRLVENTIPPYLPPIHADGHQLAQIIANLLLNAAHATPEGGRISIAAERVGFEDKIELRVSDTGEGIPPEILPHIFEPFFTTKRGKGTGLGLSICHSYARSHGGDIKVESAPGRGTTVRLVLPIHVRQPDEAESEEVIR